MATHKSAEKRHRQNLKKNERNREARSALRTAVKGTLEKVAAGDVDEAQKEAKKATSLYNKAAVKGLVHKNNAKRHVSRLQKKVTGMKKK